jgi:hypothetical protein
MLPGFQTTIPAHRTAVNSSLLLASLPNLIGVGRSERLQKMVFKQNQQATSIRLLEEELGAKLFIRSTRQVRVIAVGQAFLETAHVALQAPKAG